MVSPGATESFSERTVNFSMGISNSFSEPAIFLGTMHTRSANENAYGIGYYGFQIGVAFALERFIGDIDGTKMVMRSGSLAESFSSGGMRSLFLQKCFPNILKRNFWKSRRNIYFSDI